METWNEAEDRMMSHPRPLCRAAGRCGRWITPCVTPLPLFLPPLLCPPSMDRAVYFTLFTLVIEITNYSSVGAPKVSSPAVINLAPDWISRFASLAFRLFIYEMEAWEQMVSNISPSLMIL